MTVYDYLIRDIRLPGDLLMRLGDQEKGIDIGRHLMKSGDLTSMYMYTCICVYMFSSLEISDV